MSRRDMIFVSVSVNLAFLGLLFFLATWGGQETQELLVANEERQSLVIAPPVPEPVNVVQESARDEIDQMLRHYAVAEETKITHELPKVDLKKPASVDVTVKRGDSLDKISRANGTTVKAIMQANHLTSPRIDVGQVLKIPTGGNKEISSVEILKPSIEAEYYTLKSGDNPWKVAKQFKVRFDQLLDLNGLDEDKARNLKPGDTLRVK